ncbi:MAG: hypothetical protein FWG66_08450 [Spirochaetes bacterium]|nr:hypothetical protein [Spirochaetota bacterium]
MKYIIIIAVALAIVFLIPIPFVQPLWNAQIGRHRMERALRWTLVGLSRDEVVLKLGEPVPGRMDWWPNQSLEYILVPRDGLWDRITTHSWRRLIIFLDEDGVVERVLAGNPAHF